MVEYLGKLKVRIGSNPAEILPHASRIKTLSVGWSVVPTAERRSYTKQLVHLEGNFHHRNVIVSLL
jgi:hypothetical protein